MKVVMVTTHSATAERKTGFHFWSEALHERGHKVDFLTIGFSPISLYKKDGKKKFSKPYNKWIATKEGYQTYVWCAPFHPFTLYNEKMDKLTSPIFALYPHLLPASVKERIADADIFIVENGAGLMLVEPFHKLCPNAKFIYTVSDRFEVLTFHPVIVNSLEKAMPYIDFIRVPSHAQLDDYKDIDTPSAFISQGLEKGRFDTEYPNPYTTEKNAISVGDMLFDAASLETMAEKFPDWNFHIFGKQAKLTRSFDNVKEYGEMQFEKLVPYIKHADIGLAPYREKEGGDYLCQSSLKMLQYTYCNLPIVGPEFATIGRDHVIGYREGDVESIEAAFKAAQTYDRANIDISAVMTWGEVMDEMFKNVGLRAEPLAA